MPRKTEEIMGDGCAVGEDSDEFRFDNNSALSHVFSLVHDLSNIFNSPVRKRKVILFFKKVIIIQKP